MTTAGTEIRCRLNPLASPFSIGAVMVSATVRTVASTLVSEQPLQQRRMETATATFITGNGT